MIRAVQRASVPPCGDLQSQVPLSGPYCLLNRRKKALSALQYRRSSIRQPNRERISRSTFPMDKPNVGYGIERQGDALSVPDLDFRGDFSKLRHLVTLLCGQFCQSLRTRNLRHPNPLTRGQDNQAMMTMTLAPFPFRNDDMVRILIRTSPSRTDTIPAFRFGTWCDAMNVDFDWWTGRERNLHIVNRHPYPSSLRRVARGCPFIAALWAFRHDYFHSLISRTLPSRGDGARGISRRSEGWSPWIPT